MRHRGQGQELTGKCNDGGSPDSARNDDIVGWESLFRRPGGCDPVGAGVDRDDPGIEDEPDAGLGRLIPELRSGQARANGPVLGIEHASCADARVDKPETPSCRICS